MNKKNRDSIYAQPIRTISDFTFDEKVAAVFPDMIKRSVPGYANIISMISVLAGRYAQPQSFFYDLGCSLGAATLAIRHGAKQPGCRIIAVDNSPAMLERCRQNLTFDSGGAPADLVCADIRNIRIQRASVVVLNFTLQFLQKKDRASVLAQIHDGMLPGGVLILSEKISFENKKQNDLHIDLHHTFKRANGYSALEISQKRAALENVMIPESVPKHLERLAAAGFSRCEVWFQCFNFISILAIRETGLE